MFKNIEEAKEYAAGLAGVDPATTVFKKTEGITVVLGMDADFVENPKMPEEIKKKIRARIEAQQAFKFNDKWGKEITIVIGPSCDDLDGLAVWQIPETKRENGEIFRLTNEI
jgi:hypothetical protein